MGSANRTSTASDRRLPQAVVLAVLAALGCTPAPPASPPADPPVDPPADRPPRTLTQAPWNHDVSSPPRSELMARGPIVCADPTLADTIGAFELRTVPIPVPASVHLEGTNATVTDLNRDDVPDIIVTGDHDVYAWFGLDQLGVVEPVTLLSTPAPPAKKGLFGATAVDIDDDRDVDLIVTGRGVSDHALLNDGDAHFVDATAECGLDGYPAHFSTGASLSDLDADGDLDLFIAGHGFIDEELEFVHQFGPGEPSRLYLNEGGRFTDVSERLPPAAQDGYTFMGGWVDGDDDGDDDLYLVNDFGNVLTPSQLLLNDGGQFVEDGGALGMDQPIAGMGFGVGDLDNDGDEEVAIPAWRRNALLYHDGDVWFDEAQARGFTPAEGQTVGWGTEMVDGDNDGMMDIITAYGFVDSHFGLFNTADQPDAFHMQVRPGEFVDRAWREGFDDVASHRSIVPADLNHDGYLDYVKVGLDGLLRVYVARCDANAWLQVTLSQAAPNTGAVGAVVSVTAGDQTWTRKLRAGGTGFGPGQPQELSFGLGAADHIDRLKVVWPDGEEEVWVGLDVRQRVRISRHP